MPTKWKHPPKPKDLGNNNKPAATVENLQWPQDRPTAHPDVLQDVKLYFIQICSMASVSNQSYKEKRAAYMLSLQNVHIWEPQVFLSP